jgi:hypothetical protein
MLGESQIAQLATFFFCFAVPNWEISYFHVINLPLEILVFFPVQREKITKPASQFSINYTSHSKPWATISWTQHWHGRTMYLLLDQILL